MSVAIGMPQPAAASAPPLSSQVDQSRDHDAARGSDAGGRAAGRRSSP